ncbi:hypothetical protein [Streptomyces sp. NPDC051561]|uniref:hypothetical protein n=1 Tax=Streptomyces sp. NPDC051561 TaxID=3365658 RepID=UPI0037989CBD
MTEHTPRPFHRLRWAASHPVLTLRRNHKKSVRRHGFGLLMFTGIALFLMAVGAWLMSMPWPEHTIP